MAKSWLRLMPLLSKRQKLLIQTAAESPLPCTKTTGGDGSLRGGAWRGCPKASAGTSPAAPANTARRVGRPTIIPSPPKPDCHMLAKCQPRRYASQNDDLVHRQSGRPSCARGGGRGPVRLALDERHREGCRQTFACSERGSASA